MSTAIRTPNSIWSKLIEQQSAAAKKPDQTRGDAFVYFVGARGSGKSTLLNRFLYPERIEAPKPSEGLEYTYARKPAQFDHERKDLAHIWEIGGSQELAEEIANGDQIFLTFKQVTTATVVIVVDLSDPSSAASTALYWLDMIKKKLASTYDKFEKKGLQLPEQLRTRAKSRLYGNNEDKDVVYHSGISVLIAATKYDVFDAQESEMKKIMGRTLRYIAHSHGAHLVYTGGLHAVPRGGNDAAAQRAAMQERGMLDNFRSLMNHLIFMGLDKKLPEKLKPGLDHNAPLMVPAGCDKFRDLGRPSGSSSITDASQVASVLAEWKEMFQKFFPAAKAKAVAKAARFEIPEQYKEDEIDAVWRAKHSELESYKKANVDLESAKKKAAAQLRAPGSDGPAATVTPDKPAPTKTSSRTSKSKTPKPSGPKSSSVLDAVGPAISDDPSGDYPTAVSPEPAPAPYNNYSNYADAGDTGYASSKSSPSRYDPPTPEVVTPPVAAVPEAYESKRNLGSYAADEDLAAVPEVSTAADEPGPDGVYADSKAVDAEPDAYASVGFAEAKVSDADTGYASGKADPNGGYADANGGYADPNSGYADANGGYPDPNGGYADANGGYADPNGGYADAHADANGGYADAQADAAYHDDGNAAYADANGGAAYSGTKAGYDEANAGYGDQSGNYQDANGGYADQDGAADPNGAYQANGHYPAADNADANGGYADGHGNYADPHGGYGDANGGYGDANGGYSDANGGYGDANGSYGHANGGYGDADGGYADANGGYAGANGGYADAKGGYAEDASGGHANGSYADANGGYGEADGNYPDANGRYADANGGYADANNGYVDDETDGAYGNGNGTAGNANGSAYSKRPGTRGQDDDIDDIDDEVDFGEEVDLEDNSDRKR